MLSYIKKYLNDVQYAMPRAGIVKAIVMLQVAAFLKKKNMGWDLQGGDVLVFHDFVGKLSPRPTHETSFPLLKGGLQRQVNWVDLSLLL